MHESSDRTIDQLQAHASFARGLARGLLRDDHAADDVVQDAFVVALSQPPEKNPRAWLATVTRRLSLNRLRGNKRRDARENAVAATRPDGALPPDLVARRDTLRSVMDAVLGLPEPYQGVILLRFYEDLSPTEIAGRLGIPAPTARTQLRRGLALLRKQLDEAHGGDRRAWCLALLPIAGLAPPPGGEPDGEPGASMSSDAATTAAVLGGALVGKQIIAAGLAALALVILGSTLVGSDLLGGSGDASQTVTDVTAQRETARRRDARTRTPAPTTDGDSSTAAVTDPTSAAEPEMATEPQRLVEPGDAQIIGRVIDEETGAGMANAPVYLMRRGLAKPEWDMAEPHTHTDADGRFVCSAIATGQYYVGARHPERLYAIQPWAKAAPEAAQPVELLLRVPTTIRGRIIAPAGVSRDEARVYAETANDRRNHGLWWDRPAQSGEIAADGTFVIHGLPRSDHDVRATLRENDVYLECEARAVRAGGPPIELVLVDTMGPRTALNVRVVAPDGRAVSGLTYRRTFMGWDGSRQRGRQTVKGDLITETFRDHVRCVWVEPLSYVDADGETHRVAPTATQLGTTHGLDKVITLEPAVSLEGQVVGPGGVGVGGVRVWAAPAESDLSGSRGAEAAETEEDGTFRIEGLAPRDHVVGATTVPGAYLPPDGARARPGTPVVITLRRAAVPIVTVVGPDREPVAGADIELYLDADDDSEYDAETDAHGVARFESVEPELTYTLVVRPRKSAYAKRRIADWSPVDTTVHLATGRSLGGVLLNREGQPIPDATIEFVLNGSLDEDETTTGADGSFRFDGLPSGSMQLFVCLTDEVRNDATPRFDATAGQTALELVVDAGLVLRGNVTNWGDRYIYLGRGIRFIEDGPEPRRVIMGEHEDGRFWFAGLPDDSTGTVLIGPAPGGFIAIQHGVRTDAGELEMELVRGRKVTGKLVFPNGLSPFAARATVWAEAFGVGLRGHSPRGGQFELLGLPDAPCTVRARLQLADKEYRASAAVEPGVPLELVLREVE